MGRAPCCDKANVKRGPWSPEEDAALKSYLERHGTGGNWIALPQKAGLRRCGKSCRLRWLNYLRPDIKHGGFTDEEDNIICNLYKSMGSRWSVIASHLQGRTDNDVKNYWNTKLKKKLLAAKTNSLPTNINITNHTHQLVTSSSSPALVPKFEYHDYNNQHGFSNYLTNQMQFPTSSRDPIHHFQLPNQLPEALLDFSLTSINNNNNNHSAASPTQETTSSHSSLTMENGTISWWPNNGTDDYDRLLMEFGFGVTYDIGFGVQDQKTTEASPSLAATNSNFY